MGNSFWAQIRIGGTVDRGAFVEAFFECEGIDFDEAVDSDPFGSHVEIDPDGLTYTSESASWGEFEELETWLKERGIPFDRIGDTDDGHRTASWRPGMAAVWESASETDGSAIVAVDQVKHHLNDGTLAAWLAEQFPDIPALPAFAWLDETCTACGSNGKADGIGDPRGLYGSDNCGACGGSGRVPSQAAAQNTE